MREKVQMTADIIIVYDDGEIVLTKRKYEPFKDFWSLPGGFIKQGESLEEAANRVLNEKTGVKNVYMEQLYTFGDPARDPRSRVITVGSKRRNRTRHYDNTINRCIQ